MSRYVRDTIRAARGRRVSVDAASLLECVDAAQVLHDFVSGVSTSPDPVEVERAMERFEIAVVTLSGSVQ